MDYIGAGNSMRRSNVYLVWKNYQRRAEILGPRLDSHVLFLPHIFPSKVLRVVDYGLKFLSSVWHLLVQRPNYVIIQAPPLFAALPAYLLGIPYVIDAHNKLFQSYWGRLPFSKQLARRSMGIVVHNHEIERLARKMFSGVPVFVLRDPIEGISGAVENRNPNQFLFVCSFGSDEPVDLMLSIVAQLPEYTFVITADPRKLLQEQRERLLRFPNVKLTGFLAVADYHRALTTSAAAIVLTTREATQPSGACEALSSDTPLIISDTTLTRDLFGEWATFVNHDPASVCRAVTSAATVAIDLRCHRDTWNNAFAAELEALTGHLNAQARFSSKMSTGSSNERGPR
jgi:glycosyltransferase involved in cell wall biosynthesis